MKPDQASTQNQQPKLTAKKISISLASFDNLLEIVLFLAIGLTPLVFSPLTNELFEFPKMVFVYFLAISGLCIAGLKAYQDRQIVILNTHLNASVVFFLLTFIISTLLSIDIYTSFAGYYSRFNGGLTSLIAYLTIFYLTILYLTEEVPSKELSYSKQKPKPGKPSRMFKKLFWLVQPSSQKTNWRSYNSELKSPIIRKSQRLIWVWLLSSAIVSVWGILEHFGIDPSCYILRGTFEADCWVQDVQARVFSTFGQPNWLAAYLVATMPVGVAMLIIQENLWHRRVLWLILMLNYAAFWYTYSRSGWIGLGIALFILIPLIKYIHHQQLWKWIASLFIVCILISSTSFSLASKRTATSLESGELDSSTGQIRLLVWQGTIDTIKQYPLFGSGPETYAYSFLPHRPAELNQTTEWNFLYNKAHNEVLHIAATLGLVGLSAWIFMYFKVGQYVWRTSSTTINNQKMSPFFVLQIALFAGIIGVFISQLLGFSVVVTNLLFWISVALVIAPSVKKSTIILSNSYRQLHLFAIVVIVIALGWTTARYLSAEISAARGSASGNFFAAHHYRQAINLNPLEPSYHQNLSFIYANMAQFGGSESQTEYIQKAEHHAQIAEQLNPLNILNLKGLTYTYRQLGSIDEKFKSETIRIAQAAVHRDPYDAVARQLLAQAYLDDDQQQKSLDQYNKIIELRPHAALSYQLRSQYFQKYGQLSEAITDLEYALELEPNNSQIKKEIKEISQNSLTTRN